MSTKREYSVSYQVNDDGRVRAVVNTYTAGPGEHGGTNVGGCEQAAVRRERRMP